MALPFYNPLLLWFLPLALLPILLHLLTLHRLRTVELSTYRFLFDSYVQQRRRMQFLEALLAMLRTLFILFLVVMICRPAVEQSSKLLPGGSSGGRDVMLLMDCSASMNLRSAGKSALERAKTAAAAIVDRMGREDRLTLVRVTSRAEELFSRFTTEKSEVLERLDGLQATSSRANLHAALLSLFGPELPRRSNPVVYLFTDCQATGWSEARYQGLERVIPARTPFYVVNVAPEGEQPNLAVLGDAPKHNRAIVGLPFALQPRVVNYSKSQQAEVTLGVFIDEKEVYRTPLTLQPNETAAPRLPPYLPHEPGVKKGRFEISSRTPDRFPDDDVFRFTLQVVPRVKVLLVNGNPAADFMEDEGRFLRTALTARSSRATPDGKPDAGGDIQRSLDVQEHAEPALTAETLREVSVVILANCGKLTAQQMEWLREHVNQGGGLLIFPGDRVTPDSYNQQFFYVPGPQNDQLTAARLNPPEGNPDDEKTFAPLDELDFSHPALSVFDDPESKVKPFKKVQVYRRFKLTLPEKKSNAWPMARFASGAPALVESRLGDGRVILAAFPGHQRWTNLTARPEFVPLVLRLTEHVSRAAEIEAPSAVVADGVANFSVTRAWEPVKATVRSQSGAPIDQRLERTGPRLVGTFDQTAERGYYTFEVRSDKSDAPRSASLLFAVNLAPEESSTAVLGKEQLQSLLSSTDFHFVNASAEAQPVSEALGGRQELWRPLWFIILIAIIVLEFLMATTSGRSRLADEKAERP